MFHPRHELLAPEDPVKQIWMAATRRKTINRRKLNGLNIIKICEEMLNPPIPRALRLSGILMGGVVIVYEQKVKLLYDDVNLFLVELNKARKVKSVPDPTLLPKYKSQAKSNKKRPYSSSRHDGSGLEPVAEENSWQQPDLNFKSARLFENGLTPENDLLVETGPTQTQQPIFDLPIDLITDSILMQLKTQFDTPGTSQTESLNELAFGLNKKNAAHLFYQTCVLASRDVIRVEQEVPYGDIRISRGLNM